MVFSLHIYLVDCEWDDFREWSVCSQTCGGGVQTRTRSTKTQAEFGGHPCTGFKTDTQACNTDFCPG